MSLRGQQWPMSIVIGLFRWFPARDAWPGREGLTDTSKGLSVSGQKYKGIYSCECKELCDEFLEKRRGMILLV